MEPLTHSQAWRDQDDLDSLCKDRPLKTREIIGQNAHYGNDRVVKLYAGFPDDEALRIAFPHGLELTHHHRNAPYYRVLARLPVVAYYADDGISHYRALGVRNLLWPMTAPFVYASRLLPAGHERERRGTIFFPAHSTENESPSQSFAELADRLAELPDSYQPVTVCVYFRDYWRNAHKAFVQHGLRVVSAGHGHDPQFLFRLHHLLTHHQYASSNDVGSSCFFAIHAGCQFFFLDDSLSEDRLSADARANEIRDFLKSMAAWPRQDQLRLAERYLGTSHMLDPDELRAVLHRAKTLDRWGVSAARTDGALSLAVSRPWRPWSATRWLQSKLRPSSVPQSIEPIDAPASSPEPVAGAR